MRTQIKDPNSISQTMRKTTHKVNNLRNHKNKSNLQKLFINKKAKSINNRLANIMQIQILGNISRQSFFNRISRNLMANLIIQTQMGMKTNRIFSKD